MKKWIRWADLFTGVAAATSVDRLTTLRRLGCHASATLAPRQVLLQVYALGRVAMTSDSSAVVLAVVMSGLSLACNADRALTTAPSPNSSMTRQLVRAIAIGEEVHGTIEGHGTSQVFEFEAPSDGTLRAGVIWPATQGHLELWLNDMLAQADTPPVIGRFQVTARHKYQLTVADAAPWDYDALFIDYTLTVAIE